MKQFSPRRSMKQKRLTNASSSRLSSSTSNKRNMLRLLVVASLTVIMICFIITIMGGPQAMDNLYVLPQSAFSKIQAVMEVYNTEEVTSKEKAPPSSTLTSKIPYFQTSFSFMWWKSRRFSTRNDLMKLMIVDEENNDNDNNNKAKSERDVVVDIISTGSLGQPQLIEAQATTWASHKSVRYFFGLTENDDAEPDCSRSLTKSQMMAISDYCRKTKYTGIWQHSPLMKYQMNSYAGGKYLQEKNPGWLCAQKRPSHGIGKIGRFYREQLTSASKQANAKTATPTAAAAIFTTLPDYLILVDDDTYFNMDWFQSYVKDWDSSIPRAEAGCLIRSPLHLVNNSFAYGGYGLILSQGAIYNLIHRHIHCRTTLTNDTEKSGQRSGNANVDDDDLDSSFNQNACQRLRDNLIGERQSFQNGMSVSDLMDAHAARETYSSYPDWDSKSYPPYCLHSDWATGYYVNTYHIPNHVSDLHGEESYFQDRPDTRIYWNLGIIYHKGKPRNCKNEGFEKCDSKSEICHRISPDHMKQLTDQVKATANPNQFHKPKKDVLILDLTLKSE